MKDALYLQECFAQLVEDGRQLAKNSSPNHPYSDLVHDLLGAAKITQCRAAEVRYLYEAVSLAKRDPARRQANLHAAAHVVRAAAETVADLESRFPAPRYSICLCGALVGRQHRDLSRNAGCMLESLLRQ